MEREETIGLFCQVGVSDKEYHADLIKVGDGWKVNGRNGRRGGTLKTQEKTKDPVPYAKAKKVYDALVLSKLKDAYTIGASGPAYQDVPNGDLFTGILPQLLNAVDESGLERLLSDPAWIMEEKKDGERRMVSNVGGEWFGINRKGMRVALPMSIAGDLADAGEGTVIDGEIIGDVLYVFDVLSYEGRSVMGLPHGKRYSILEAFLLSLKAHPSISLVQAHQIEVAKRATFDRIRKLAGEGVVFKLVGASYEPGRPNSGGDALKFKFVERATLFVIEQNSTKRSVQIGALDESGSPVPLGNVTILPNFVVPDVGAIVEVQYLYAYPGAAGCIYQPVYLGVRADQDRADCKLSQLKYKPMAEAAAA